MSQQPTEETLCHWQLLTVPRQVVPLPAGAKSLYVFLLGNKPNLIALANPNNEIELKVLVTYTSIELTHRALKGPHLGSYIDPDTQAQMHVFDETMHLGLHKAQPADQVRHNA